MSHLNNQYGHFYDPVGSQSNKQPRGYTYQMPTSSASQYPSAATANYPNSGYQGYGSTYGDQQYGSSGQGASNTSQAATALSNLSAGYSQPSSASRASGSNQDQSQWGDANYSAYMAGNMQGQSRTHSNNSPLYPQANSAGTFGRMSASDQSQSTSPTYAQQAYQNARASNTPANQSYHTGYTQPAQSTQTQSQQPPRYASPLQAVQAQQQGHGRQQSGGSTHQVSQQAQPSNRQQSASVESTATTVNPSQVYDDRAERERKARIEAEKRRKREAEEAARKAEEERKVAEKRKEEEARQAEEQRKKAEADEAKKKAQAERRKEQRKQKQAEKRESNTAATALQKMASSGGMGAMDNDVPPANAEEAEMRAMFKKMREFNAKNPAMLAKLWEEERKAHASQSPQQAKATPVPASETPVQASSSNLPPPAPSATPTQQQQYRPFQKPPPPKQASTAQNITTSNQPIAMQSTTSLWPPQKKGALAEAAAKWLNGLPTNAGKHIEGSTIMDILERNPSYVQLCEALEAHSLRFERSMLARALLKAVPDGLKAPTQQPPPLRADPPGAVNGAAVSVSGPDEPPKKKRGRPPKDDHDSYAPRKPKTNFQQGPVAYETPGFGSLAHAAQEVNSMDSGPPPQMQGGPVQPPSWANPYFANESHQTPLNGSRGPSQGRAPSQSQPPEPKPEVKPEELRKPPANKEEAARKTFGDLVDLTAEDSDDDGPPKKILQTANGQMNGVGAPPPQYGRPNGPPGFKSFMQPVNYQEFMNRSKAPPPPVMYRPPGAMAPGAPPVPVQNQPPPKPPMPKPRGPTEEQKQQERVKGKMLVEPIMRDRVARKSKYDSRTIARDVLLATGRHPDMRSLNAHLNSMQRLLSGHGGGYEAEGGKGDRSDLSTIRWDIIDPELPAEKAESKKPVAGATGVEDVAADADDEDELAIVPPRGLHTVDHGDGTVNYISVHEQMTGKPKQKRRGRPPRSSMPGISGSATETPLRATPAGDATNSAPAPRGRAPKAVAAAPSPSGAVGYSAFRRYDENGNVIKKKGRPVGWRKNIHSREAAGLPPAATGSNQPSKLRQSQNVNPEAEPKYQVYKCRWKGCAAELHNLETLKKHVVKIHGRPNDHQMYECLWEGCTPETAQVGKGKGRAEEVTMFDDVTRWIGHVDQKHLRPVAWKLGDGPKGGLSDHNATDSEAYLSDARGRSVTPIITPSASHSQGEAGPSSNFPATLYSGPGRSSRHPQHLTKDERNAAAELEKLAQQRTVVGPSLDRTGARMANEKRRKGYLDDEEFEDEVVSEEERPPDFGGEEEEDGKSGDGEKGDKMEE